MLLNFVSATMFPEITMEVCVEWTILPSGNREYRSTATRGRRW